MAIELIRDQIEVADRYSGLQRRVVFDIYGGSRKYQLAMAYRNRTWLGTLSSGVDVIEDVTMVGSDDLSPAELMNSWLLEFQRFELASEHSPSTVADLAEVARVVDAYGARAIICLVEVEREAS